MSRVIKSTLLFLILLSTQTFASSGNINRILSLVDYIGGDYKNAVSNGQVINQDEYNEMLDFSSSINELWKNYDNNINTDTDYAEQFRQLKVNIDSKGPVTEIEQLASKLKRSIISDFDIKTYPQKKPDLTKGRIIYNTNCTSCHGYSGAGDGVLSENLVPMPTNFTDPDINSGFSPFKVYNTVKFGIEGTAMPAFRTLDEDEKWDVGFYVLSLGFPGGGNAGNQINVGPNIPDDIKDYKNLANLSNDELVSKISGSDIKVEDTLAFLRTDYIENDAETYSDDPINFAKVKLTSALSYYKADETKKSLNEAIDAYLEGFEKVEADLMAKDGSLVMDIEKKMSILRASIKSGDEVSSIENQVQVLLTDLDRSQEKLSGSAIGPLVAFINSFSIIVREALESILIIVAIIAFLATSGAKNQIRYIHYGWIAAVAAGFVTWFLAKTIFEISGASRELIEGITSLLAAVVLFYVSYWLISKIEVEKWKDYVKSKVQSALDKKSIIALTSVSFLAVYREAFETVLFYQALLYQTEVSKIHVLWGLIAGLAVISVVAVLIFRLSVRIPLKYFFSFTSLFLYMLCFILVGKGVKELQEAGFVPATKLEFIPYIDVIGLYPTYETIIPQLLIVFAFLFAFAWIAYITQVKAKQEINTSVTKIYDEIQTVQASFDHIKGHIVEWRKCEDIDVEAEELDKQIHEVAEDFDQLRTKLEKFNITITNM